MIMIKKTIICCFVLAVSVCACKPKQKATVSTANVKEQKQPVSEPAATSEQKQVVAKTIGKVSHQYRETGCPTVVIIMTVENPIILIPKDKLPAELDVDSQEISFYYKPLKMPQPKGCIKGMPAELKDVEKVKR